MLPVAPASPDLGEGDALTPRRRGPAIEALLALGVGLLLAAVWRRPQDLTTTVPGDARDPLLQSWVLAWPAHALTSADRLWDANVFAPTSNSLAFTDPLLGYLPFGLLGEGPAATVARYNVVLLFATGLAFAGTWLLVRQLGLGRAAALLAATAFAFSPWRVSQLNHLQILSSGGIPLVLAMLARGHGVGLRTAERPPRPLWAVAGWVTAAWQVSLGFGLGLQLGYLLASVTVGAALVTLARVRRGRAWPARSLLAADAIGMLVFLGISAALAQPFLAAVEQHPQARRALSEVSFYSPTPSAFVTAPADSLLWGRYTATDREDVGGINEKALFPGLVVTVVAAAGLLAGPWSRRRVAVLAVSVVLIALCAMGTSGPAGGRWTYLLLYEHAPGWQGVRTPSRLVTTAWLGLALLSAHGVVVLSRLLSRSTSMSARPLALAVSLVLSTVAFTEGLDTAGQTVVRPVPTVLLRTLPAPVMVLPSEDSFDQDVMRWSTDGFPRVVNGVSGFTPVELEQLREAASRLPDPAALERLRASGVRSLLLLPALLPGTRYEGVDVGALGGLEGVVVEPQGDAVVVRLGGPS